MSIETYSGRFSTAGIVVNTNEWESIELTIWNDAAVTVNLTVAHYMMRDFNYYADILAENPLSFWPISYTDPTTAPYTYANLARSNLPMTGGAAPSMAYLPGSPAYAAYVRSTSYQASRAGLGDMLTRASAGLGFAVDGWLYVNGLTNYLVSEIGTSRIDCYVTAAGVMTLALGPTVVTGPTVSGGWHYLYYDWDGTNAHFQVDENGRVAVALARPTLTVGAPTTYLNTGGNCYLDNVAIYSSPLAQANSNWHWEDLQYPTRTVTDYPAALQGIGAGAHASLILDREVASSLPLGQQLLLISDQPPGTFYNLVLRNRD